MNDFPWDKRGAFLSRIREAIWTSIAIVPLAFWSTLLALLYLALFTDRNGQVVAVMQVLSGILLGLGVTYTGRRLFDRGLDLKLGNGNTAATAQKPPAGA